MNKIRTLVAHNDELVKNEIINSIKCLEFVEIVGTANQKCFSKNIILVI